jgi:hypothetical protein
VKYEVLASFRRDWQRLSDEERQMFRDLLPRFNEACDRFAVDPSASWPASLCIKAIEGAPGIWEMTRSFSGPDGRATFEWVTIEGARVLRWRRIGGHAIFREP